MRWIVPVLFSLAFSGMPGCTYYPATADWSNGQLVMRANFPTARKVQIIPEGTTRIEVRVTGEGIPAGSVLGATLTPDQTEARFVGVPAGAKTIDVRAFDAEGTPVAMGSSALTVIAGATVAAHIRLSLLTDNGQFQLVLE